MDNTSRLWDVETGECLHTLLGHTAEIVSLDFDTTGTRIVTGSFDNTVKIWYVRTHVHTCIHVCLHIRSIVYDEYECIL